MTLPSKLVVLKDGVEIYRMDKWFGCIGQDQKNFWIRGKECHPIHIWQKNLLDGVTTLHVGERDLDEETRWGKMKAL